MEMKGVFDPAWTGEGSWRDELIVWRWSRGEELIVPRRRCESESEKSENYAREPHFETNNLGNYRGR